jgi:hypothetical protein
MKPSPPNYSIEPTYASRLRELPSAADVDCCALFNARWSGGLSASMWSLVEKWRLGF